MIIQETIKYTYKGREYPSLEGIKTQVENEIGEVFIDQINHKLTSDGLLTPSQKLAIMELLAHTGIRNQLIGLLNVSYVDEYELLCNILNLK